MNRIDVRARIQGRVQGVGLRMFIVEKAHGLKVTGWVKNHDDGSVELLGQAERERLDELLDHIRVGPPSSRIDAVHLEWSRATKRYTGFHING